MRSGKSGRMKRKEGRRGQSDSEERRSGSVRGRARKRARTDCVSALGRQTGSWQHRAELPP